MNDACAYNQQSSKHAQVIMVKGADFKINRDRLHLGPGTDMKQGITKDLSCVRVGQI